MKTTANPDAIILACWATADPLLRQLETDPALIAMGDKPMLQRVLEKLIDLGCGRIAVVHGNHPQQAQALLGNGERWGCDISHHYAAEGDSPLRLLARLAPEEGRNCVLAPADTVALTNLDRNEISVACSLESGKPQWSGWAVVPAGTIRWIAEAVRERSDLAAGLALAKSRVVMTSTISTSSIAATLDSLPHLFDRPAGAEGISRRPRSDGIWIGNGSRIHPSAKLRAPVFIGNNVLVAEHAELGPNTMIGDGCIVDAGSHIEESVLLAKTYVGRDLDISRSMLAGNTLVNSRLGVALQIQDTEFLRNTDRRDLGRPKASLTQRALAAILWLVLAPLGLVWRLRSGDGAKVQGASIGVPCAVAGAYQSSKVRFAMSHDAIHAARAGAWTRHFFATFLPGLREAISGRVALIGLQPRTIGEILALPYYWQRLYRTTPVGLIGEGLLQGAEGASPEMGYAGDALSAGPMSLTHILSLLRRYAAQVAAEALGRTPKHTETSGKTSFEALV